MRVELLHSIQAFRRGLRERNQRKPAQLCLRSCAVCRSRSEPQIDGDRLDRACHETSRPVRILAVYRTARSSCRRACGKGAGHDCSVRKGQRAAAGLGADHTRRLPPATDHGQSERLPYSKV